MRHKVLERQLKKYLGENFKIPKEWENFLAAVSEAYQHFDDDRALLDRSMELSSRELAAINQQLQQEKSRDEALLVSIGDGVVATDEYGVVILMNREAERLLGASFEETAGKSWSDVIVAVDENGKAIPQHKRPLERALTAGEKISATTASDFYLMRKNGRIFPAASTTSPIIINGRITGAIEIFRDITLEKDVDRAKTEFVSLASHQLRTPLSTISWYAEMLLNGDAGKLKAEQIRYLHEIYQGNQRMIQLVNALLNVSRLDLGTFVIEAVPTNVTEVADSAVDELKPQIKERLIKFERRYEKGLPVIPADPKLLRIIFQNLLSNAVKYTAPKGTVSLAIAKESRDLRITVADTGYGIPSDQQAKIFTKLFRADNVREKETTGTGLGLYLVKAVVEQAGGKVWFESKENKGTTFYVTIPLAGMKKKSGTKPLEGRML